MGFRTWKPGRLTAILVAFTAVTFAPSPAGADFNSGWYTRDPCSPNVLRDPITIVFTHNASGARSLNHVQHHLSWGYPTSGITQYFVSHGVCAAMDGQRASAGTFSSRYHIRVRKTYHGDTTWGTTAVGAPHYDQLTGCGHKVPTNGFNNGRQANINGFSGTHHTHQGTVNWGNTLPIRQCDASTAASNGNVAWFSIPNSNH
jgi:hypothetical protein